MGRSRTRFACQACGQTTSKWFGRCPGCGSWNTLVEESQPSSRPSASSNGSGKGAEPRSLSEINPDAEHRLPLDWPEFDRVLGGGLVPGSVVLVGGNPGVGKSTLLLQASRRFAERWGEVLYVSGEESPRQIRLRAERVQAVSEAVYILPEIHLEAIVEVIETRRPRLVVVDSVQTLISEALDSGPGTIAQVREAAHRLQQVATSLEIPTVLVGHVNKLGHLAGPKVLEHAVDAVLYFEGDSQTPYRLLRAAKNRFGSTEEIGVFRMQGTGLEEVVDPSQAFLSERPTDSPGSVVFAAMEGSRPLLVEVQALVAPAPFGGTPRRQATGVDRQRAGIVLAVLERRYGLPLQSHDVYINVAGGVRVDEPGADLAIALSVVSSLQDRPVRSDVVVFGEVGLTGEIRGVVHPERRVMEAAKLGFRRVILPAAQAARFQATPGLRLSGVATVAEAIAEGITGEKREVGPIARRAAP